MSKKSHYPSVDTLIAALASYNGLVRKQARDSLVEIGKPAVPALLEILTHQSGQVRWEAAKVLSQIGDPVAVSAMIEALEDADLGVRWLAAEGLIRAGREGLEPLLQALINHSDSIWLREGARHILRSLAGDEDLHDAVAPVLVTMETSIEPALKVPLAAEKALRMLRHSTKEKTL